MCVCVCVCGGVARGGSFPLLVCIYFPSKLVERAPDMYIFSLSKTLVAAAAATQPLHLLILVQLSRALRGYMPQDKGGLIGSKWDHLERKLVGSE